MARRRKPRSIRKFQEGNPVGNSLVYLDIDVPGETSCRIHIELFSDDLPNTSNNFRLLCTGERVSNSIAKSLWYKDTIIHRIIPGFMMQGGDITNGNGTGGSSISGRAFEDEHSIGSVSMAHQEDSNKSQFFITFTDASWLDGKHVVFGQVLKEDLPILEKIEMFGSESGRPIKEVLIKESGQICGYGIAK